MTAPSLTAQPGEYWGYRRRDSGPSERVLVESIESTKTRVRSLVTFDDGLQESVPGARLKVLWAEVEECDLLMSNWEKIGEDTLDEVEERCAWLVFELLVPDEVAELGWRPVSNTADIADVADVETFSAMIGLDVRDYAKEFTSLWLDDTLVLSPHATAVIAERLCRINPTVVLDRVIDDEQKAWHKCKHGSQHDPVLKANDGWRPHEWEYKWYLEYDRPRHEPLRQWCGHRTVTLHERLKAAEAESHRLDVLLEETITRLEKYVRPEQT